MVGLSRGLTRRNLGEYDRVLDDVYLDSCCDPLLSILIVWLTYSSTRRRRHRLRDQLGSDAFEVGCYNRAPIFTVHHWNLRTPE